MRPQIDALVSKLKRLDSLKEHPEAVRHVIQSLAHYSFVHERLRPSDAFENFMAAYHIWQATIGYPPHSSDVRNDRQLESAHFAITGDELPKSQSLGHAVDCTVRKWPYARCSCGLIDAMGAMEEAETAGEKVAAEKKLDKVRNNQSPGPSHKSPVAYRSSVGSGFTIPGIEGKFIWTSTVLGQQVPDMDRVVEILAAGLVGRSPEIDLTDKDLKKRVRKIIWDHTFGSTPNSKGIPIVECGCDEQFESGEAWAVHVRKLIWKELKG